jgi:hypothetical protein
MDRNTLAKLFYGEQEMRAPWATDSPVRFDVWAAFAQAGPAGPPRQVDVILAINEEHGVRHALDRLHNDPAIPAHPIAAGGFVVVWLTLESLVRTVLPLTNLRGLLRLARQQPRDRLAEMARADESPLPLYDPEEGEARRQERQRHLGWLLRLLRAVVASSQGLTGVVPAPDQPDPAQVVADMLSGVPLDDEAPRLPESAPGGVSDRRRRYPILSVTTNRRASPAVTRSRETIKSDAAESLFSVDCSAIGWAVLDSGIDATHQAFDAWDTTGAQPVSLGSRIVRILDFVGARDGLAVETLDDGLIDWARALPDLEMAVPGLPADPLLRPPPSTANPPRPYVAPVNPHGTHVAGILGAAWPQQSFRGICPTIRLYDFRVLDGTGHGDEFSIVTALQAVRHINEQAGRLVIAGVNLSLSVPHDVATHSCGWTPVCMECDRLVRSGVVVVAAAGNTAFGGGGRTLGGDYRGISISDPGNADLVITVGSTHRSNPHRHGVSYFSGRGPTADGRLKPDLLAPGEDIDGPVPGDGVAAMHGTSQAAAHVSGAAAMLIARYRELIGRPERVKDILCATASDLARERDFQGHGLVDVLRAMQSL